MDVRVGLWRKLSAKELMLLNITLESPWDCKEIKPVNPKGNQPWIFIGRTEAPIFWPPDVKSGLIGKITSCWKRLKAGGEGTIEDEMVGWHHWLDGQEFKQVLGVGDGQGSLACCSSWGSKESDTNERLNWTEAVVWKKKALKLYIKRLTYYNQIGYISGIQRWLNIRKNWSI